MELNATVIIIHFSENVQIFFSHIENIKQIYSKSEKAAIQKITEQQVDLVLLEIEKTALHNDIIEHLQTQFPKLPIIAYNLKEHHHAEEILHTGVQDYIVLNSISPEQLKISLTSSIVRNRNMEKKLSSSEKRFDDLVTKADIAIGIDDENGNVIYCNHAFYKMFGYSELDDIAFSHNLLVHPDDIDKVKDYHTRRLKGENVPNKYEIRGIKKDGTQIYIEFVHSSMLENNGKFIGTKTYIWDVTDRKRNEEALEFSESFNRNLTENSPIGILHINSRGVITFENKAFKKLVGATKEGPSGFPGKNINEISITKNINLTKIFKEISEGKNIKGLETEVELYKGKKLDIQIYANPLFNSNNQYDGAIVLINDISNRKASERALIESEEKYRLLFEKSKDPILLIENNKFIDCNQAALSLLKYENKSSVIDKHPSQLSPDFQSDGESSYEKANKMMDIASKKGHHKFEWIHKNAKGEKIWIDVSLILIPHMGSYKLYTIWQDITEKKHATEALKENEEKYRVLFENSPVAIGITTLQGDLIKFNEKMCKMHGFEKDEFEKIKIPTLYKDENDRVNLLKKLQKDKLIRDYETELLRKDKTSFHANISITPFKIQDNEVNLVVIQDIDEKKKSELKLKSSEEKFRFLAENANDVIWITNNEPKFTYVSPSVRKLLGFSTHEMIGLKVEETVGEESVKTLLKSIAEVQNMIESGIREIPPVILELQHITKDGHEVWTESVINTILNDKNEIDFFIGVSRDITERKKAHTIQEIITNIIDAVNTTRSINEFYAFIEKEIGKALKTNNFIIGLYNSDQNRIELPFMKDKFGNIESVPANRNLSAIVLNSNKPLLLSESEILEYLANDEIDLYGEVSKCWLGVPFGSKDKAKGILILQDYEQKDAFTSEDLKLLEIVAKQIAISIHRKKTQDQIDKLSRSVDQSPAAVVITNLQSQIEYTNKKFNEITGYSFDEVKGKNPRILNSGKTPKSVYQQMWHNLKNGKEWKGVFRNRKKNGALYWEEAWIAPFYDSTGKKTHYIGVKEDITERIQSETELQDKEQRYRVLANATQEAIFISNGGICIDINDKAGEMFGYSNKELVGIPLTNLFASQNKKQVQKNILSGYEKTYEAIAVKKDGSEFPVLIQGKSFIYKEVETRLTTIRDLTKEKVYISSIKLNEARLQSLLEISNFDAKTEQELLNYTLKQAIHLTESEIGYIYFYDQEAKQFVQSSVSNDSNKIKDMELSAQYNFNESGIWQEVIQQNIPIVINELKNHESLKNKLPKGHALLTRFLIIPVIIDNKIVAITALGNKASDYDDSDVRQLKLLMDSAWRVLERKRTFEELKIAKNRAEESDKLKSAFLATMSHELRTPLNAVIGFSDLMDTSLSVEELINYAKYINKSGLHLLNIIEDIFNISILESSEVEINMREIKLRNFNKDIEQMALVEQNKQNKNNIEFRYKGIEEYESQIIISDKEKLKQIIEHLISNAFKFINKGYIEYGIKDLDNENITFFIQDTGIGIPENMHDVIFERFRQVDESHTRQHGGTGLGLSICKKLTELLNGKIWVESKENEGSCFYLKIPVEMVETKISMDSNGEMSIEKNLDLKGKTILIAEDEDSNFIFLKHILEPTGVQIIRAFNGSEAVELYVKKDVDLILMDIKMPVLNGLDATKVIREYGNEIPIIAQTAYAMYGDKEKALNAGCSDYISKPVKREDLFRLLAKYLINKK